MGVARPPPKDLGVARRPPQEVAEGGAQPPRPQGRQPLRATPAPRAATTHLYFIYIYKTNIFFIIYIFLL